MSKLLNAFGISGRSKRKRLEFLFTFISIFHEIRRLFQLEQNFKLKFETQDCLFIEEEFKKSVFGF